MENNEYTVHTLASYNIGMQFLFVTQLQKHIEYSNINMLTHETLWNLCTLEYSRVKSPAFTYIHSHTVHIHLGER